MPKNIDDVILPERRRSIRNIPIPEGRRKSDKPSRVSVKKQAPPLDEEEYSPAPPQRLNIPRRQHSSRRRILLAGLAGALILVFAVLSIFNGATLAYTPRSSTLSFDNETHAARKTGETGLLYSIVKLSGDKGVEVTTSGEEEVSRKASGTIIVYNDASTEPQRLIENTRFEAPSGKIYRIAVAIVVPGKKTVGGVSQPGTIEATVLADLAGESYNSGLTDFTVPGLKGTPRYSTVYARSKTPMSGGFVGQEKKVSQADLAKAKSGLQSALSEELLAKAQAEVPTDFILFPSLSSVTFEDLPQTSVSGDKAMANLRGHLYGIMLKRSDLARELSGKKITLSDGEIVDMRDFDGLEIAFAGTAPADLLSVDKIDFKVAGSAVVLWRTDEVALKADLKGKKKSDIPNILKNYPTITSASATVRPFWKSSLPSDPDKITVRELKVQ